MTWPEYPGRTKTGCPPSPVSVEEDSHSSQEQAAETPKARVNETGKVLGWPKSSLRFLPERTFWLTQYLEAGG